MRTASPPRPVWILLATCLGFVAVLVDVSVVNVALDRLRDAFGAGITDLQWVVNAYALVFAASLLIAGALGDRLGAKRMLLAGYAVFTLASVACGLAPSMPALIVARLVQGVGAALLVPNSLAVLRLAFHGEAARGRAIGWWSAGGGIALAAGPLIGGLLVAASGWRSIFLINLPVGIAGFWLAARCAPDTAPQRGRSLDLPGQAAGAIALAALTFAATEAGALGWKDPIVAGAFVLCVLAAAAFVRIEARNPAAMLPAALWRSRTVRCATALGMIANLVFYGVVFALSLLFQTGWHLSPLATGLAFLPMMGILMVMNVAAGRLASRLGARALATIGLLVSALGYLAMWPAIAAQSPWLMVLPMLAAGGGIALTIPTITHATLAAASSAQSGVASGLLNAARQMGGVIGVALFGFLVRGTDAGALAHGMVRALGTSALLLLAGAATAWFNLARPAAHVGKAAEALRGAACDRPLS